MGGKIITRLNFVMQSIYFLYFRSRHGISNSKQPKIFKIGVGKIQSASSRTIKLRVYNPKKGNWNFSSKYQEVIVFSVLTGRIGISLFFKGLHDSTFFWVIGPLNYNFPYLSSFQTSIIDLYFIFDSLFAHRYSILNLLLGNLHDRRITPVGALCAGCKEVR